MTVVDRPLAAGTHSFNIQMERRPAGVYFYTLEAGAFVSTRSMIKMQ